jgi:hypothetical protein
MEARGLRIGDRGSRIGETTEGLRELIAILYLLSSIHAAR